VDLARLRRGLDRSRSAASEHAVATGFVSAWRLVRLLPEQRARRLFERLADRMYRADGASVRRLRSNLHRIQPDLDGAQLEQLTHRAVRSYLRYWCESFRLPSWPLEDLLSRTRTVHEERLRGPHGQGRGVVAALPHQANWDWAGAWACGTGVPVLTVAERLSPERLYDEFVAYRESLGMRILPLTGAEPPLPQLEEALRGGAFVPLLSDRDLSRSAVDVVLCGEPSRMPPGPALLARATGAALVPITLGYVGDDLEITFHPEIEVGPGEEGIGRAMQEVADAFTVSLRAYPEDWHMMQRVFTDDLPDEARVRVRGDR
jgi:lauroyl/myristoyl acyltransferase